MDAILQFFSQTFMNFTWLAVFLVAMLPIAEAKVAIPFALSKSLWGVHALSPFWAGFVSFFGSLLPAIFIIPFLKPLFGLLKRTKWFKKSIEFYERLFIQKAKKQEHRVQVQLYKRTVEVAQVDHQTIQQVMVVTSGQKPVVTPQKNLGKLKKLMQFVTLIFFVALPLPLAGVWMSSAVAAFGSMKFWQSFFAIALGNLFEVIFVTLLCAIFKNSIGIVLLVTILLIAVYVIIMVFLHKKQKRNNPLLPKRAK